jgi:hypothetical protein
MLIKDYLDTFEKFKPARSQEKEIWRVANMD